MQIPIDIFHPMLAALAAYLIGSISFAVVVSRVMGLADPRSYGSHNPGATNVLRSGNKVAALLTLVLDSVKGWLPVYAVVHEGAAYGLGQGTVALVALAAFAGHVWPVFFRFRGGKGVATAAGVLLGIEPFLGLASLATWLIVAFFLRYSSLAALASAVFAPAYYLLGHRIAWHSVDEVMTSVVVMSAILVWRHQLNIVKLVRGEESRIGGNHKLGSDSN
ncbi:MAG: glycerol-3-phosphate 1-O-acyltransferase PlsY [Betaproteobacteria bacterium]|nr:glycerol-3-phosphate 1-O-acyltransferase PlsY [Betaproteobacteria bacterium]